jgi:transcriptional regulator with XRE-family HTH domain
VKLNEEQFINKFGENLRILRKEKHLSQEHLANDADIPINQIGRIERGEIGTTISTLFSIAKALNIDIVELFEFEK